ncbi:MAG: DUF721 domain-containing protein [Rhodanobacter denitrificans]|uniref:DUF721 domain-containing protein n=1 Tax=Rhodanobacter denitrificans TaxID=666685 RepID=A0A2W5KKJ5_9GAMM|nr:MAG: DUF721 domain-containing protein [Rhodanobacter denitrificans]
MQPPHRRRHATTDGFSSAADCVDLGTLAQKARALEILDGRLRRLLPEALARECRLADIRNGRLVFLANSPTWAGRLRLHEATLLAEARSACEGRIERFAVKVAHRPPVPPEPAWQKPLSTGTARHLRAAAQSIADPELKALYLRLASLAGD